MRIDPDHNYIVWRRRDGFIHASCTSTFHLPRETERLKLKDRQIFGVFPNWPDAKICIWKHRLEQGWQPDFTDGRYPDFRPGPVGIICEGSITCVRQATHLIPHDTRRLIPACDTCGNLELGLLT